MPETSWHFKGDSFSQGHYRIVALAKALAAQRSYVHWLDAQGDSPSVKKRSAISNWQSAPSPPRGWVGAEAEG